jgi:hypothetical protein
MTPRWLSILLGLRDGQSKVRIPSDARDFLFFKPPISTLGHTQAPIQWVLTFPDGVKAAGTWSCSPPSIVEVRNGWSYTSIPPNMRSWCAHGQVYFFFHIASEMCKTNSAPRGSASGSGDSEASSGRWADKMLHACKLLMAGDVMS